MRNTAKVKRVSQKLLDRRDDRSKVSWRLLKAGRRTSRKNANKFMLGAIVDYQVLADDAWENARQFAEDVLGDPPQLWESIVTGWTKSQWNRKSTWRQCGLHHRFPSAHNRVRAIGVDILNLYEGDARLIWRNQTPSEVFCRLQELGDRGVGEQLSRMIIGALMDTNQIEGKGEFKADLHVRRVLGRLFDGEQVSPVRALEIGDALVPGNSWCIDGVLFDHGKSLCRSHSPRCMDCFLAKECTFNRAKSKPDEKKKSKATLQV